MQRRSYGARLTMFVSPDVLNAPVPAAFPSAVAPSRATGCDLAESDVPSNFLDNLPHERSTLAEMALGPGDSRLALTNGGLAAGVDTLNPFSTPCLHTATPSFSTDPDETSTLGDGHGCDFDVVVNVVIPVASFDCFRT